MGAWIETQMANNPNQGLKSHPMWVRGLKPVTTPAQTIVEASHPMWVRGLKHVKNSIF